MQLEYFASVEISYSKPYSNEVSFRLAADDSTTDMLVYTSRV